MAQFRTIFRKDGRYWLAVTTHGKTVYLYPQHSAGEVIQGKEK